MISLLPYSHKTGINEEINLANVLNSILISFVTNIGIYSLFSMYLNMFLISPGFYLIIDLTSLGKWD